MLGCEALSYGEGEETMSDDLPDLFTRTRTTDPDTSREAIAAIYEGLGDLQKRVYRVLKSLGPVPDRTLCKAIWDLQPSTVRTRRDELVKAGMVEFTGDKVKIGKTNHMVWRAI